MRICMAHWQSSRLMMSNTEDLVSSKKSELIPLEESKTSKTSSSLPSEYYVPSNASLNSEWSSSSTSSSRNESSTVAINLSSGSLNSKQTCCDYISFTPKRFKASSRFRKCPRCVPLLLTYFMFALLGFIERGSFLVLFYSLISYGRLSPPETEAVYLGVRGSVHLLYPVAGLIADTYFGRYKVILTGLTVVWVGSALLAAGFTRLDPIFDTNFDNGVWSAGIITLIGIGYAVMGVGLAGIRVNLIPFGVDQVPDASSGELSSYFHWYYWNLAVGQLLATIVLPYIYVTSFLSYVFLLMNLAVSVFIVVLILCKSKLHIYFKIGNPLRLVFNVTRCAVTMRNRRPPFRSAFHVGQPQPPMMDRAMKEYGGTHTVEQVEDVKTFFRVLFILLSFIGYFAIFSQIETTTIFQGFRLRQPYTSNCTFTTLENLGQYTAHNHFDRRIQCYLKVVPLSIGYAAANLLPLLIMIPLFDRVLYICLNGWKWFSMLGRIGIGKLFILMSVTCALLIEIVRLRSFREETVGQMKHPILINSIRFHTEYSDSVHVASDISALWLWPQYMFFSFAELFCNITAVEFIYAQSPGAMKGLLLGLFYATEGVSMVLSSFLMLILSKLPKMSFCSYFANTKHFYYEMVTKGTCMENSTQSTLTDSTPPLHESSCVDTAICAYIIFAIVALLSAVMFTVAAIRYKFRKRDPDPVFPFWLYPDTHKKEHVCLRALRLLCCCSREREWQV